MSRQRSIKINKCHIIMKQVYQIILCFINIFCLVFQLSELKESGREGATGKRNFVRNSYRYNVVFITYFSAQQILTTTSIVNACFNSHRSSCDLNIENILFILIYLGSKNLSLKRNSHCRFIENKILFLIRLYIQILLYLDTMIYI